MISLTGCGNDEAVIELEQESIRTGMAADPDETADCEPQNNVTVYVCGAVNHPGVYELPEGTRIVDALHAAGGMDPFADHDHINQAMLLEDGARIYIPTSDETEGISPGGDISGMDLSASEGTPARINLNTADAAQLMTLPGIGEAKAALIIQYREENGRFNAIEDIMKINGIKEGMFNRIRDMITV